MAVNKVIYNGATLVDLTGVTVTADDMAAGKRAMGADGNEVVGLLPKVTIDGKLDATSSNPIQNKAVAEALANMGGGSGDYLPLTGGTVTGGITAPNFQTGSGTSNYFQCRKFRGEGNADTYYHAVDFGYSGHDSVDFYEYDPNWRFYKCTSGNKSSAVLIGNIDSNGWNGGARLTGAPTAPTAAAGTNNTQIATTAFVQNSLGSYVKTVNNTAPDENGNVTIAIGGGSPSITVDAELSETSTNAIQNKAVTLKFAKMADTIEDTLETSLSQKVDKTSLATIATSGSYNDLTNKPTVVKSVNNVKPDSNGNVNISTSSGGGVSTSIQNSWTALQSFDLALLSVEKYKTGYANGNSVKPSSVTAVYNATGSFTLDLNNFSYLLSTGQSLVFTAYIKANADYPLTITNGGTLKYTGSPSDLAITSAGLLLNILIMLDSSGNKTSIVQASKLS